MNNSSENKGQHWLLLTGRAYSHYHQGVASALCVIGICINTVFVVVLSRRHMRHCVTNVLLMGVAVNDLIVRTSMIVYFMINYCSVYYYTYEWMSFVRVYANVTVICHSCSLWLTVVMAVLRYIVLTSNLPPNNEWNKSLKQGFKLIGGTFLFVLLGYAINIARSEIVENGIQLAPMLAPECNTALTLENFKQLRGINNTVLSIAIDGRVYTWQMSYMMGERPWFAKHKIVGGINYWLQAIVFKLIPCVFLAVFSILLIRILIVSLHRRRRLKGTDSHPEMYKTAMLVSIAIVYFLTEAPQGVMSFVTGVMRQSSSAATRDLALMWYNECGDLLDLLALLQSTFNFILYCLMSQQFRKELVNVVDICNVQKCRRNKTTAEQVQLVDTPAAPVTRTMHGQTIDTTMQQRPSSPTTPTTDENDEIVV